MFIRVCGVVLVSAVGFISCVVHALSVSGRVMCVGLLCGLCVSRVPSSSVNVRVRGVLFWWRVFALALLIRIPLPTGVCLVLAVMLMRDRCVLRF